MSKRTEYNLDDSGHMRALGVELARLGFIENLVDVDPNDGDSVYGALSDLDWYEARCAGSTRSRGRSGGGPSTCCATRTP